MRSRSGSACVPSTRSTRSNSAPNVASPVASTSTARSPSLSRAPVRIEDPPSAAGSDAQTKVEADEQAYGTRHKLKRYFLGPGFEGMSDGSSWRRKGKQKANDDRDERDRGDEESVWEDEGSGSESTVSSRWERVDGKRKLAKGLRVGRMEVSEASQSTAQTAMALRARRPSVHDWKGSSFEVGEDLRDMVKRRERRLRAEQEERDRKQALEEEEKKFLGLHLRDRTNSSTTTSRTLASNSSFVTAPTHPPAAPPPSPSAFQLSQPPLHIDEKYPDLTKTLCRRPSGPPPLERSTSHPPMILVSAEPPIPIRSILRSKYETGQNGSTLGNGHPHRPPSSSLLQAPATTDALPLPGKANSLRPIRRESSNGATVRFPAFPHEGSVLGEEVPTGARPPASPQEVLARPAPEVKLPEHKLKDPRPLMRAAADKMLHRKKRGDEVLRKERMLVRDDWSPREDLPKSFDEYNARKYPTIGGKWEELAVVWRPGRIELWGEYRFNIAASLAGSKKLRAVIPLQPRKTHLSIYSSVDLVFCLTHRPVSTSILSAVSSRKSTNGDEPADDKSLRSPHHSKSTKRAYTHLRTSGTNVFLFRARTTPTAKEWIWYLYRELGGQVPRSLEISVPTLGAKIRMAIPLDLPEPEDEEIGARVTEDDRAGEGYRLLKPRAVVEACVEQLGKVGEWKDLVEEAKRVGATFRLAWRRDGVLDWVEEGDDAAETDYAVIGGIATRQESIDPILELRVAVHYPTSVTQPRSTPTASVKLFEPPAVEGFVKRIKKNGQNERIYLTSHLGAVFRCSPSRAHPPELPVPVASTPHNPAALALNPLVFGLAGMAKSGKEKDKFWRQVSNRHGIKQERGRDWTLKSMDAAKGDLPEIEDSDIEGRAILDMIDYSERKRAFLQITDAQGFIALSEFINVEPDVVEVPGGQWDATVDPGGHEGMQMADDTKRLRGLRSFIAVTRMGRKAKFECHSIGVRDEWVERLNALIRYWTIRDRADAVAQMELSPSGSLVDKLPPARSGDEHVTPPPTREELLSSALLATVYNWCILDGCRAILKSSTLHIKKELRGTFRKRHVLLLPGTLIEFNVYDRDMHGQPLPSPYHRRKFTLSLRDCYVYSGSLTSAFLAGSTNTAAWEPANGNQHRFPRCYTATDGLRTVDDEEDCTFVIVRTKHGGDGKHKKLNSKGVVRVYRARSKLERDQFVYTLNSAIERLLRAESGREDSLRDFSWLDQDKGH
ncbi:hypothetical protein JCM10212_002823 [Sporobolomyces blumeae]